MNSVVKDALLTTREAALALGIDVRTPAGLRQWKTLKSKALRHGMPKKDRSSGEKYSYDDILMLAKLMRTKDKRHAMRTKLIGMVKEQLRNDGY